MRKWPILIFSFILLSGCIQQAPHEKEIAKQHSLLAGSEDVFLKIDETGRYDSSLEEKFISTADRGYQINPELADSILTDCFSEAPVTEAGLEDVDAFLEFYEKFPEQTEKLIDSGVKGCELVNKIKNPVFTKAYTSGIGLEASLNLSNIQYDADAEKYIAELAKFNDKPELQKALTSELRGSVKPDDLDWINLPLPYLNAIYGDGTADQYEKQHGLMFSDVPDIQKVVLGLGKSLDGITPDEIKADEWLRKVIYNEEANKRLEKIRIKDMNDPTGKSDKIFSYPLVLTDMTDYQLTDYGVGIIITKGRQGLSGKYTDYVGPSGFRGPIDPDGIIDQVNVASFLKLSGNKAEHYKRDFRLPNWDEKTRNLKDRNKTIEVTEEMFHSGVDKKVNNVIFFSGTPLHVRQINICTDKGGTFHSSSLFIDLPNTDYGTDLGVSYYPDGIATDSITKHPSVTTYGMTIPSTRLGILHDVILFDKQMNMIFGVPEEYKKMHPIENFRTVYASGFLRFLASNPEAVLGALSIG